MYWSHGAVDKKQGFILESQYPNFFIKTSEHVKLPKQILSVFAGSWNKSIQLLMKCNLLWDRNILMSYANEIIL